MKISGKRVGILSHCFLNLGAPAIYETFGKKIDGFAGQFGARCGEDYNDWERQMGKQPWFAIWNAIEHRKRVQQLTMFCKRESQLGR